MTAPTNHDAVALAPVSWLDFERLARDHAKPVTDAIPTPLPTWNRSCRDEGGGLGLAPGWFVVVAGKPGAGKSLMAVNLLVSAMRAGRHVCCLSYEMSKSQLVTRALAVLSGCDVQRLERGATFNRTTFDEAARVWDDTVPGMLYLSERPDRSVRAMVDLVTEAVDECDCSLVIVDYAQLVGRGELPHSGIFERTQQVSGALQQAAFETRATVVALSQFNRGTLSLRKEEPGPEGLKGGSLDEDADQVVMLDYSDFNRTITGATTNVVIGKNRHGPTPKIPVSWSYANLQVRELTSLDESQQRIRDQQRPFNGQSVGLRRA